jgi:hypothetical protein
MRSSGTSVTTCPSGAARRATRRPVGARHGLLQLGTEHGEIDQRGDPLEVIALGRQLPQPFLHVEEPRLPNHRHPPRQSSSVNQPNGFTARGF